MARRRYDDNRVDDPPSDRWRSAGPQLADGNDLVGLFRHFDLTRHQTMITSSPNRAGLARLVLDRRERPDMLNQLGGGSFSA